MVQSVLVVDDEPSILLALEFMMKGAGFEVRTAADGFEVVNAIRVVYGADSRDLGSDRP